MDTEEIFQAYGAAEITLPPELQWLVSLVVSGYLQGQQQQSALLLPFIKGIQAYNTHPYRRSNSSVPLIWQEGSTRLFDYGTGIDNAPIVLFIPSLINRSYILDLNEEKSLLRYLAGQHIHSYLIDWDEPVASEYGFNCSHYIERISTIIDLLNLRHGRQVMLAGYCMGGLMALAAALQNSSAVKALVLLATPWDFHQTRLNYHSLAPVVMETVDAIIGKMEMVPRHLIQAFFYNLNLQAVYEKFAAFSLLDTSSREAQEFVAVEQWVNDGIAITTPVARECLMEWSYGNAPLQGKWYVGGNAVLPSEVAMPVFIATAEHDHIVPPASALPLSSLIPGAHSVIIPSGHVGMIIGRAGKEHLWKGLADWIWSVHSAGG